MSEKMAAAERVRKYLAERGRANGIDREEIHGFHVGDEREAILLASDLATLAAQPAEQASAGSGWISVADQLPEVDEDDVAYVWAVHIGAPGLPMPQRAGKVRYHKTLGWQPENSTGWDWIVTYWQYFPSLPPTQGE